MFDYNQIYLSLVCIPSWQVTRSYWSFEFRDFPLHAPLTLVDVLLDYLQVLRECTKENRILVKKQEKPNEKMFLVHKTY